MIDVHFFRSLERQIPLAGTLQRMGHTDFYPNGGYDQPNCPKTPGKIINLILQLGSMNIEGNVTIFIESVQLNRIRHR